MRVFCDMDQTLVAQLGPIGFHQFPWAEGGPQIWNEVLHTGPVLLSRLPPERMARGFFEKRMWVDRYLGRSVVMIVVPDSCSKSMLCQPGDLLIDDNEKFCEEWRAAQGRAIHHKRWRETITQIRIALKVVL